MRPFGSAGFGFPIDYRLLEGSRHFISCPESNDPAEDGCLSGTASMDGAAIDVWCGRDEKQRWEARIGL